MPIYRPSELHQLGVRAKKALSQNFLIDHNILEKICTAASIQEGDQILEIGPGPGALTECLLKKGAFVYAVEKDRELAEKLTRFDSKNLKVFCDDALTFPINDLPSGIKVVANLPYHITTPVITRFIDQYPKISSLTVMVQKEVGQRMVAKENTPMYSSFTLFLNAYSTPRYCFTVKPNSFYPAPSVHSCVVHLPLKPFPFSFSPEEFFAMTRKAFGQRRKMLRSSLRDIEGIDEALKALSFETVRPQELSLADFGALFEKLKSKHNSQ
ncbi:MAG: ribosomal RNA small subunit methyltransferase A [Verrucomicrobia bacterium]|nr:ribosomal RNA small subunit methyltransferase A [Verrucomicrobiota bacterium]